MTRDDDFIRQLEGYLDEFEGATPLPPSVRKAVREQLPTIRPTGSRFRLTERLVVAAAGFALVALVGFNLLRSISGVGGPSASSSATFEPSPSPTFAAGSLGTGRHSLTVDGLPLSFSLSTPRWTFGPIESTSVPGEWTYRTLFISKDAGGTQGAEAIIFWTTFPDGTEADPCASLRSSAIGPSIADLAGAVAAAPGVELVTGPSDVIIGGRVAKHVLLTVHEDLGCDPGYFFTWQDEQWGPLWGGTDVGDTMAVWIVDINGKRLFIEAESQFRWGSQLTEEVEQIINSIRFEQ